MSSEEKTVEELFSEVKEEYDKIVDNEYSKIYYALRSHRVPLGSKYAGQTVKTIAAMLAWWRKGFKSISISMLEDVTGMIYVGKKSEKSRSSWFSRMHRLGDFNVVTVLREKRFEQAKSAGPCPYRFMLTSTFAEKVGASEQEEHKHVITLRADACIAGYSFELKCDCEDKVIVRLI